MRQYRKIIAINESTGERREFTGTYAAAKALGTNNGAITYAANYGGTCKGWKIYDEPAKIREKIAELEAQIEMLEGTEAK